MPVDDLLTLVTKLGRRIDAHSAPLKQNEALTRYALIDPLLRALGWDTDDPEAVIPEYNVQTGHADYALLGCGSPAVIVEAKKLDTPLEGKVVEQGIGYCIKKGIKYFAVTDGRRWRLYETHRPVPIAQKEITSFDLKEPSAAEVCRKALALWRAGVESQHVSPLIFPGVPSGVHLPDSSKSPSAQSPLEPPGVWKALSELKSAKGKNKPIEVMFPDGERVSIKAWKHMMFEVTCWLVANGWLNKDLCPISKAEGSANYLVSGTPEHATGKAFNSPQEIDSLYVETSGGANTLAAGARRIIGRVGQEAAQFKIRFPE